MREEGMWVAYTKGIEQDLSSAVSDKDLNKLKNQRLRYVEHR